MHFVAIVWLLGFAHVNGKLESLRENPLPNLLSSGITNLFTGRAIVGVIYSKSFLEMDQTTHFLQANDLQRIFVLFQLDGPNMCNYHEVRLKYLVFFVEEGFAKQEAMYKCTQAWTSSSTFYFVMLRPLFSVKTLAKDIWNTHNILNFLLIFLDAVQKVSQISYNPFSKTFSGNVTGRTTNLQGYRIRGIYTVNSIESSDSLLNDHIIFLQYFGRMMNASYTIAFQASYNPYTQLEKVLKGEADIDLNPAIVDWGILENCVGVSYAGPLVTLIPKQSGSSSKFTLLVFDYYSWLAFAAVHFALSKLSNWGAPGPFEHSCKIFSLSNASLSFFFLNLFQIYIISALTASMSFHTIDTVQGLIERNLTIIAPIRMDKYLPRQLRKQLKTVFILEAYQKLIGPEEPSTDEAVVIWQISFDKLKYAKPRALARFYTLKEPIGAISSARHSKANSPFKENFELALSRMEEFCLSKISCQNWRRQKPEDPAEHFQLGLDKLHSVFYILILGFFGSLAAFVGELLVPTKSRRRLRDL